MKCIHCAIVLFIFGEHGLWAISGPEEGKDAIDGKICAILENTDAGGNIDTDCDVFDGDIGDF